MTEFDEQVQQEIINQNMVVKKINIDKNKRNRLYTTKVLESIINALGEVESRGMYGECSINITVQDGVIQGYSTTVNKKYR